MLKEIFALVMIFAICAGAAADESKSDFKMAFKQRAVPQICNSSQGMMMKCYSLNSIQCAKQINSELESCLNELDASMPKSFTPAQGADTGEKLAQCTLKHFAEKTAVKVSAPADQEKCKKFSAALLNPAGKPANKPAN